MVLPQAVRCIEAFHSKMDASTLSLFAIVPSHSRYVVRRDASNAPAPMELELDSLAASIVLRYAFCRLRLFQSLASKINSGYPW